MMRINKKRLKRFLGERFIDCYHQVKFGALNFICLFFPLRDEIIFESHPDLADNTFEVFKYLYSRGLYHRMKFTWIVDDPKKYLDRNDWEKTEYIAFRSDSCMERLKKYIRCNRAKVSITCNRMIPRYMVNIKQLNVYLDHGSPLKDMKENGKPLNYSVGYVVTQAAFFEPYTLDQYGIEKRQIVCAGVPRNDQLFGKYASIGAVVPNPEKYKIIVWVPTFRQKKNSDRCDCSYELPLGIPVIYDRESLMKVNDFLKDRNLFLLIKPHPAQDLSKVAHIDLTNVKILTNEEMIDHHIQTNELLAQTDAMITDYSGIYYDYLLLDRPIGITTDDYEVYKAQKGFVFQNPLDILQGVYINDVADMLSFFDAVSMGIDEKRAERNRIMHLTNDYLDAENTKRVCDFITNEIETRFGIAAK